MVSHRLARTGKVRLGCLLTLVVLGAVSYYGWGAARIALNFYEYQDAMEQEARFAARTANETIIAGLRAKADSLALPEAAQKVQIHRQGNKVWIWAKYIELIELPGYQMEMELTPHAERVF